MSHPNNPIVYNEWSKLKEENTNFAEKLEQLNRVRESIFSQSGWSSKNVRNLFIMIIIIACQLSNYSIISGEPIVKVAR